MDPVKRDKTIEQGEVRNTLIQVHYSSYNVFDQHFLLYSVIFQLYFLAKIFHCPYVLNLTLKWFLEKSIKVSNQEILEAIHQYDCSEMILRKQKVTYWGIMAAWVWLKSHQLFSLYGFSSFFLHFETQITIEHPFSGDL